MEDFSFVFGHPPAVHSSSWLAEQPVSVPHQRSNNVDSMLEEVPEQRSNNEHTTEIDLNEVPPMDDDVDQSFVIDRNELAHDGLLSDEQIMAKKFNSEEEAYDWYRTYALVNGFGIRRDNRRSFDEFGQQIKSRIFLCARQGRRLQKYYDRPDRKREHMNDTRCSCTARLRIYRSSPTEQFCVKSFVREHAHELADRDVTYKLRCHRNVTDHDVEHVLSLNEVGMRVCDTFQLAVSQAGGYGKVGYMVKDLYNKLQSIRKAYSNSGDGQLALQYLDTLDQTNGGVFKRFTLGENDQLQSIFWCDLRCQRDWARFGDVLVFDSTYKTNMYLKPVVIFSGVNNHFQITVFAVAILNDETTETYKWVLRCFMEAMSNKAPISVITDGDLAMKAAIAEIFPLARHRLCAWHLCRNAEGTLKLGPEFMKDFGKCLKKRSDINQWNDDWQSMVDKWRIANRKWVQAAHMTRHLWAEAFLKDTFFAGQQTTQRCESINKFFKQHLKPTFNLQAFCQGFMWGLEKLRDNERGQHCISDQGNPVLSSQFKELEEHAAMYYTRAIFFKFKDQATKAADYIIVHFQPLDAYEIDAIYIRKNKENAALVQGGSLRASATFPNDRYLLEISSPNSKGRIFYEDITLRDILFDSSYRGGGLLVVDSARIRVNNCFFLHFTLIGILVQRGHETFISESFLGQHSTVGGDSGERDFSGGAIDISSNDNVVTDVAIFSAATGIILRGGANIITGVHCYNKATYFGGVGIIVKAGQTRIDNCYLDYNSIVVEDPHQVHVTNGFFLGDGNVVVKSVNGRISGLNVVNNMFSGGGRNVPIVKLEGSFASVDQVVIDKNNVNGMSLRSTIGRLAVPGNGTKWVVDFSEILVFPNRISHVHYSLYAPGVLEFPSHAVTNISGNVVVVESDKAVNGVVSVVVDQYSMAGEVNLFI